MHQNAASSSGDVADLFGNRTLAKRANCLSALFNLTDRLYRAQSLDDCYQAALEAISGALESERASILLFDEAGVMRFVAHRGLSEQYRTAVEGHTPWKPGERDPQPIFVEDIDATSEPEALKATIRAEGIRGLAFVPLVARGGVIGKFMTYYREPHAFDDDESELAVLIARQLGFSLERMRAEEARRGAEDELRRKQERLRLATATGKIGLWEWDIPAGQVLWTDSLYPIHGVDRDRFNPTMEGFAALVHPEDRDRVLEALRRTLDEDAPYELEFRVVRPDGGVVWLFTNATVLRQGGRPVRLVGATADISNRKGAEARLRESEERFRLMSEQAPVMIWMSDVDGGCLHLNRMLRQFWGVREEEVSAFDWRSSMHPDDAPEIGQRMAEALARRSSVRVEGRYLDAKGGYRTLRTDAQPRFSGSGEFLGMIGVNVDVTERERAEAALRQSEERFRLAVEAAPSGMIAIDPDGRILLLNAQAEILFGYSRDELVGRSIETLVPERFRATHPGLRSKYGDRPDARPMGAGRELFALRKDNTEVPVEIGLSPIETSEGPAVLAAVANISERKQAEAQRELLLAELEHRIKNTLAVVKGIAHQTFRGGAASPEARQAFDGRLMTLAAAHGLLTRANWEKASLEEIAASVRQACATDVQRISTNGPHVLLQPKQALAVAMALHELCTNALKHGALSNESGEVVVEWRRAEGPEARFQLSWRERGGPPVSPPEHRGFGSRLIEQALAQALDGHVVLDFKPEGLVCTLEAALAEPGDADWLHGSKG